jgi:hypothetical protein
MTKSDDTVTDMIDIGSKKFISEIEYLVRTNRTSYTDAILHFCEKHAIEPETAASFIRSNAVLREAMRKEFEDMNMLPKRARLPI